MGIVDERNRQPDSTHSISELILKQVGGQPFSTGEEVAVDEWVSVSDAHREFYEQSVNLEFPEGDWKLYVEIEQGKVAARERVIAAPPVKQLKTGRVRKLVISLVAACMLGAIAYVSWTILQHRTGKAPSYVVKQPDSLQAEIRYGQYKATLLRAGKGKIVLDSVRQQQLMQDEGAVTIDISRQLVYSDQGKVADTTLYDTLLTANGETFAVKLSDGTIVRLNNGSSLIYPVAFSGNERRVILTGEAFFDVTKNAARPFIVEASPAPGKAEIRIEVTGTQFNVMAYANEPAIQTTLAEGSIKIYKGDTSIPLKPGQQAIATGNSIEVVTGVDVDKFTSWVREEFKFTSGSDIMTIIRQLERWYDITVQFNGNIPTGTFYGVIDRNGNLPDVLEGLKQFKMQYKLEGRRLIITR